MHAPTAHVPFPDLKRGLLLTALLVSGLVATGGAGAAGRTEVVVTLDAPPLAQAVASSRALTGAARARRLDLRTPTSLGYLAQLGRSQRTLARRIEAAIPGAGVRWHYSVVLNGFAVVVPRDRLERLDRVPGVARVWPNLTYRSLLDRSPAIVGAPQIWGPTLDTAGQDVKIGIVDDGVDQSHPFFNPNGYTVPPGFPKGQTAYTTAKVIVARAFAPASPRYANASKPFDPDQSEHATHVAGIAAGNHGLSFNSNRGAVSLSGIAPKAFLGNYKVLTIPTMSGVGLDGNSAEIVAGIEAAVKDGMDVINLSLGEPEIEPVRDIVVAAIGAAADAGVVPAIAAGNDFDVFGRGSIGSPGSAPKAITAAAVTKSKVVADFSSGGPTPVSDALKPDVSAPGVSILSSVPVADGLFTEFSGTSMASPHVAGAAALLRQRHPEWSVAQIKSALVQTGTAVLPAKGTGEAPVTREGGGLIDLRRADVPLIFVSPTSASFGLLRRGETATRTIRLVDAGGGAGPWSVAVKAQAGDPRIAVTVAPQANVPGPLAVTVTIGGAAPDREAYGFIVLTRGADIRRIPYWLRAIVPQLGREPHRTLRATGTYKGSTKGMASLVTTYRYPELGSGLGLTNTLRGPEQVFRVDLTKSAANFGVAVLSRGKSSKVEPRVVFAGDEDRLTGYAGLPLNLNPYLLTFLRPEPVAGAVRPAAGSYDIVFDSRTADGAGAYTFRFWINDQTPPLARLRSAAAVAGGKLALTVSDSGSGIDADSILALVDGKSRPMTFDPRTGEVEVKLGATAEFEAVAKGRHELSFQVSDYQEAKNMENVAPILPNTRRVETSFTIR